MNTAYLKKLAIETAVVALMTVIAGSFSGWVVSMVIPSELSEACKGWNKYRQMEISLALTGVIVHLTCELLKINKYYCSNGAACML